MNAEIHQLRPKPTAINWMCSACGVDAGCNCGAPLMSKAKRVADEIAANPDKPNKQIARETGADPKQVRRERQKLGGDMSPPDERQMRTLIAESFDEDEDEIVAPTPAEKRVAFMVFSNEAMLLAKYDGPIDDEVLAAARATASAWCRLVETMEKIK